MLILCIILVKELISIKELILNSELVTFILVEVLKYLGSVRIISKNAFFALSCHPLGLHVLFLHHLGLFQALTYRSWLSVFLSIIKLLTF